MSRTIKYNNVGVFVGPAPATGHHFIGLDGTLTDDDTQHNLIYQIKRATSMSHSFALTHEEPVILGRMGYQYRPIINKPSVSFDFTYYQMGVINELRLGMMCNFEEPTGTNQGSAFYDNNFAASLFSGYYTRELGLKGGVKWPYDYRDSRNIFVGIADDGENLSDNPDFGVLAFGNCYINSYSSSAAVGRIPSCSVSFVGDNVEYHAGRSGIQIPAVTPTSGNSLNRNCVVPVPTSDDEGPLSVVQPGGITIDIASRVVDYTGITTGNLSVDNLTIDINEAKIQNYDLGVSFQREELRSLGDDYPIDRQINFPILASVDFSIIVGDNKTGDMLDLIDRDDDYDITIRLKNVACDLSTDETYVRYDLRGAKLNNVNFTSSIGSNRVGSMSFSVECDPTELTHGLFISGKTNMLGDADYPSGIPLH
jgi:hypothetical protein